MTLDEHIHKAEEDAKMAEFDTEWGIGNYFIDRTEALEYAKECKQLAEWLKDYKRLKEQESSGDLISRADLLDMVEDMTDQFGVKHRVITEGMISLLPSVKPQEPKTEKVIKMRDATPEEQEAIAKYIKSISKPTGVNFWALEQEPCEDAISRQAVDLLVDELARAISDERCCISRGRSIATIMKDILDLPSVNPQEPSGETVSLEAFKQVMRERDIAIEQLKELGYGFGQKIEPQTGHWKRISMDKYSEHSKYWYRCDRCGKDNLGNTDWCPNCGAKMVEHRKGANE